jgi:hypothetical protein
MLKLTIKQSQIKNFCSNNELRPALTHVYYDAREKKLVATDAHVLVAIECESDYPKSLLIPVKAFPTAKEVYTEIGEFSVYQYHITRMPKKGIETQEQIKISPEQFPKWLSVWPNGENKALDSIGVNPALLQPFADLMKFKYNKYLLWEFYGSDKAIKVTYKSEDLNFTGLIMPIQPPSES